MKRWLRTSSSDSKMTSHTRSHPTLLSCCLPLLIVCHRGNTNQDILNSEHIIQWRRGTYDSRKSIKFINQRPRSCCFRLGDRNTDICSRWLMCWQISIFLKKHRLLKDQFPEVQSPSAGTNHLYTLLQRRLEPHWAFITWECRIAGWIKALNLYGSLWKMCLAILTNPVISRRSWLIKKWMLVISVIKVQASHKYNSFSMQDN